MQMSLKLENFRRDVVLRISLQAISSNKIWRLQCKYRKKFYSATNQHKNLVSYLEACPVRRSARRDNADVLCSVHPYGGHVMIVVSHPSGGCQVEITTKPFFSDVTQEIWRTEFVSLFEKICISFLLQSQPFCHESEVCQHFRVTLITELRYWKQIVSCLP